LISGDGIQKVLKVSCTAHSSNQSTPEEIGTARLLLNTQKKKLIYFCPVVKMNNLHTPIFHSYIAGTRIWGKLTRHWFNDIKEQTSLSIPKCIRTAHDRHK